MFQFLRRISGSFLPRPDRPWRDDATSHAPTIGHKRRYSVIEPDDDDAPSTAKRTKSDVTKPDECESASEKESTSVSPCPVEGQDVKEVTKGVKEVELEDKEETEDPLSIQPEGVPLPDSPSGSPAPEPEPEPEVPEPAAKPDVVEETKDEEHTEDKDSAAREDSAEDEAEDNINGITEPRPITTNTSTDAILVADDLHDTPASLALEVEA